MCSDVGEVSLNLLTADACSRLADGEQAQISNALAFSCARTSAVAFSEMPKILSSIGRIQTQAPNSSAVANTTLDVSLLDEIARQIDAEAKLDVWSKWEKHMQNAYEAHQIIERRARPPGDRCLSAIDLTAAAPEDEIAKTVQYNPSRAVTVPRLPQQPQEKVDGAPPGQPQAGKPGNLFSMWKQQKQDLPGQMRGSSSSTSTALASAAFSKSSIFAKSQQRVPTAEASPPAEDAATLPEAGCPFTSAGAMLGHKKRKFGAGAGGGAAGAGEAGAAGGTGKKRLGMCAGRTAFNPPFRGKSDAQAGQHGDGGAGGGAASKKQPGSGDEESPYSEAAQALLTQPDGSIPESILKLEPATVNTVCNDIIETSSAIQWDDIAGQQHAKALVQELVVWPMQNPSLFTGARAPPKGLLLFGPPGTGKTLIGKAIACNIQATFFSVSASSLTSKWIGESEKLVKALFAVAEVAQPAVIFIDELDSILTVRKSDGEHEASRRLKTELLVQMEGCDPSSANRRILVIGATNRPEDLDEAARRRMPKQLYIPLPCDEARRQMVLRQVGPGSGVTSALTEADITKIVSKTAGYSGSDMKNLVQEACQGPVRQAVVAHGAAVSELTEDDLRPVMLKDFRAACLAQKASVHPDEVARYIDYDARHGARQMVAVEDMDDDADDW